MNQNVLRFGNYIILKLCILPGCVGPFRVDRSDIVSTCQVDALLFRRFNVSCYDRRSQAAMSQITLADFTDYHYCIMVVVIIITGVSRGIMYVQLSCSRNR